jgi:hypothetical protein
MCPAAGQSAEQGSMTLLSTKYTSKFAVPSDVFRYINCLGRCQSRAHPAVSVDPRRSKRFDSSQLELCGAISLAKSAETALQPKPLRIMLNSA